MSHKLVSQYRTGRKEGRKDRETERQSNRKGEKGEREHTAGGSDNDGAGQ